MNQFVEDIERFNAMYGLPMPAVPTTAHLPIVTRMVQFRKIMLDELSEVDDIIANGGRDEVQDLTNLADWLGDIIVYAASEMRRFGIPMEPTLKIIMESNFSKLGADGQPIISAGKVQKGPNYWKPEPKLQQMLEDARG